MPLVTVRRTLACYKVVCYVVVGGAARILASVTSGAGRLNCTAIRGLAGPLPGTYPREGVVQSLVMKLPAVLESYPISSRGRAIVGVLWSLM